MADKNVIVKTSNRNLTEASQANWWEQLLNRLRNRDIRTQVLVHPCVIDGRATLVHERGLAAANPEGYAHLLAYAEANGYLVREDRRADFIEGIKRVKDPNRANLMTIIVLVAAVASRSVAAQPGQPPDQPVATEGFQSGDLNDLQLDIDSIPAGANLIAGLIGWINGHSTFKYDVHDAPDVQKVPASELASIAFGGNLPKNVNPANLRIYGLYNFNDQTVYLLDTIDLATEQGKAILLHELVHYLQYQAGVDKSVECRNQLESLAYVLEARYMSEQQLDSGITDSHIQRAGQCPA